MSYRDDAQRCLLRLHEGKVAADRAAADAEEAFLAAAVALTDKARPSAERVRIAAHARAIGIPRGTLVSRLEGYRSEHNADT